MPFPSQNIHRPARRRLGRGQHPRPEPITTTVMGSGHTVRVVFSAPVTVTGTIGIVLDGNTEITQTIVDEQTVSILFANFVAGDPWNLPTPVANTFAYTGAAILGGEGPNMLDPDNVLHSAGGNYYPPPTNVVQIGVQFGVNNTSETGTYNPTPPTPAQATTFTNNGDGTYTIDFSLPFTSFTFVDNNQILLYNGITGLWQPVNAGSASGAAQIIVTSPTADTAASAAVFLGDADGLVFPTGLRLGIPVA